MGDSNDINETDDDELLPSGAFVRGSSHVVLLPPQLRQQIVSTEADKFAQAVDALTAEWEWSGGGDGVLITHKLQNSLRWVSLISSHIFARGAYSKASLEKLACTAMSITIAGDGYAFAQFRWANILTRVLYSNKRVLRVTFPWRPLLTIIQRGHLRRSSGYLGGLTAHGHGSGINRLVHRARRFFPAGSAAEIYAEFRPGLLDLGTSDPMLALGFISLFLPAQHIAWDDSVDWAGIVRELVALFPAVPRSSSRYWSTVLLNKLAALRKHDVRDVGGWDAHLPAIMAQITARFELPIGNAQGAPPFYRAVPQECGGLFSFEIHGRPTSAAKFIAYGLRNGAGAGTAGAARMLCDVLEHYFHPSNDGPWSPSLAPFLRGLTKHLLKRKAAEGRGVLGPAAWGGPLTDETLDAFAADVSRLVARAQYSKRGDLARTAVAAAAGFAYLAPKRILPLVAARFEAALEALTATHQLVAAIETLSACVRPLLCAPPELVDPSAGEDAPPDTRLSAPPAQLLAAALEAVIPGLDANDPPKTLATLRFFVSALSCVGTLSESESGASGGGAAVPLPWGEWVDGVLERVFSLLENCDPGTGGARHGGGGTADGPGTAAASESTFLMYSTSMFRPAMELLFGRLDREMLLRAQRQVAKWALGSTLPGVTCEVGVLICAAVWADPASAAPVLLSPLLSRLLEDARPAVASAAAGPLSSAAEARLRYVASMLQGAVQYAGPQLPPLGAQLKEATALLFECARLARSVALAESASMLLGTLLASLISYYPLDMYRAEAPPDGAADAPCARWVAAGVDGDGWGSLPPDAEARWHAPSAEEAALARDLLKTFGEAPAEAVTRAAAAGQPMDKDTLRAAVLQIEGVLAGARSCIPEFDGVARASAGGGAAASGPGHLGLVGAVGEPLGDGGTRERLAAALCAAAQLASADDIECLQMVARCADDLLNRGHREYVDQGQASLAWRNDSASLTQPRGGAVNPVVAELSSDPRWRKRRPRWLELESAYIWLVWRASQAAYFELGAPPPDFPAASPFGAEAGAAQQAAAQFRPPAAFSALAQALCGLCRHRYKAVRDAATTPLEVFAKRFPAAADGVFQPMVEVLRGGSKAGTEQEMALIGACKVLQCRYVTRRAAWDAPWLAQLCASLVQSSGHEGLLAQSALHSLFTFVAFRFSPTGLTARDPRTGALVAPLERLRAELVAGTFAGAGAASSADAAAAAALAAAAAGTAAAPTPWRYSLLRHAIVAFLTTPGKEGAAAGPLVSFFLAALDSDIAPLRPFAVCLILSFLSGTGGAAAASTPEEERAAEAGREAAAAALAAAVQQPGFAARVFQRLAHMHAAAEGGMGGAGSILGDSSWEHLGRTLGAIVFPREWPATKKTLSALWTGAFSLASARLWREAFAAAPQAALQAMRAPLTEAVAGPGADRGARAAAAEAFAGLIGSGCLAVSGGMSADWGEWVRPTFLRAIWEAPAESAETWVASVRCALDPSVDPLSPLSPAAHASRAALLAALSEPLPATSAAGQQSRRLSMLAGATHQLSCRWRGRQGAAAEALRSLMEPFQRSLIAEAAASGRHPFRTVREEVASCSEWTVASLMASSLPLRPTCRIPAPGQTADALWGSLAEASRAAAEGMEVCEAPAERDGAEAAARAFCDSLAEQLGPAAEAVMSAPPPDTVMADAPTSGAAPSAPADGGGGQASEAAAFCETAAMFVSQASRNGDGPFLAPTLVRLLPSLLRLQDTPDPDFNLVIAHATTSLKYVELPAAALHDAVRSLIAALEVPAWKARLAALAFAQAFAFRHAYLFAEADAGALREAVVARLADSKLEVRQLAMQTLGGMLKGPGAAAAAALRERFMRGAVAAQKAAAAERARRRAAKAAADAAGGRGPPLPPLDEAAAVARHANLLGLSACVLSCPYDHPDWMADTLVVLAASAVEPSGPIKDTVNRTFADWKRTHHDTMAQTRAAFGEARWEQIMDGLELSPSYYC